MIPNSIEKIVLRNGLRGELFGELMKTIKDLRAERIILDSSFKTVFLSQEDLEAHRR